MRRAALDTRFTISEEDATMSQIANILASDNDVAPRVRDVLPGMEEHPLLAELKDLEVPAALKPAVDPKDFAHRSFRDDEFWRHIPGYADVDRATFLDWKFQNKHSITSVDKLATMLGNLVSPAFLDDVRAGIVRAPMNVRISPYIVSLTNWADPYRDPLRIQFLPVASTQLADHPRLTLDSLHERADAPTPGLTHRYYDKALFLPLDVCPVYCRFCTRSYAIGGDTDTVQKARLKPDPKRWHTASPTSPRAPRSRTSWSPAATSICCRPPTSAPSAICCWRFRTSAASASRPRVRPCRR